MRESTILLACVGSLLISIRIHAAETSPDISQLQPSAASQLSPNVAERYQLEDPAHDSWLAERFAAAADRQLKQLGAFLAVPGKNRQLPGDVASNQATCSPLRPQNLKPVYHGDEFHVDRAGSDEIDGEASVVDSLGVLAESLRGGEVSVKFKIITVVLDDDTADTTVLYEAASVRTPGAAVEQHAVWDIAWQNATSDVPTIAAIRVREFEEAVNNQRQTLWFEDRTSGVLGRNPSYEDQLIYGNDHWQRRLDLSLGGHFSGHDGICVGDVNGDGLDDVYVCQAGGVPNRLFVQQPDGTALDTSAAAGVDWMDVSHSALLLDLDNDGDQDLVVGVGPNLLFLENDGVGRFQERRRTPTRRSNPMSLAAADFDGDGRLDVYVCLYSSSAPITKRLISNSEAGPTPLYSNPAVYHDANNGAGNILLRNRGDWVFSDWTSRAALDANNQRFSQAASWEDFDNDGDPDLYVANDYGRNNLYRNDGGTFTDVAEQLDVEDIAASMSVSWGDYNSDGHLDLYIANMFSAAGSRITSQSGFQPEANSKVRQMMQRHARGNTLYANNGDGTLSDTSIEAGVTMGRWAWSSNFVDLNNDGREDLVIANGFVTQEDSGDL